MTLAEALQQKLSDLPPHAGPAPAPHAVPLDGGVTVELSAKRLDTIAAEHQQIRVTRPAGAESVGEWAGAIAARVRGLREDLKVIEVDATIDQAILRSEEPAARGGVRSYYEVHLKGNDTATVARYQADRDAGTPREAVGFPLTHEVTAQLVSDIVGEPPMG